LITTPSVIVENERNNIKIILIRYEKLNCQFSLKLYEDIILMRKYGVGEIFASFALVECMVNIQLDNEELVPLKCENKCHSMLFKRKKNNIQK
jgi:hypothetical protein